MTASNSGLPLSFRFKHVCVLFTVFCYYYLYSVKLMLFFSWLLTSDENLCFINSYNGNVHEHIFNCSTQILMAANVCLLKPSGVCEILHDESIQLLTSAVKPRIIFLLLRASAASYTCISIRTSCLLLHTQAVPLCLLR